MIAISLQHGFARKEIFDALAWPREMNAIAIDDDLAGARTRVVVRAHHEPIRACGMHREEIAGGKTEIAVAR